MASPEVGTRVYVTHLRCEGTLRYRGPIMGIQGDWLGVELDEPKGKTDGSMGNVQYFLCGPNHAIFLRGVGVQLAGATDHTPTSRTSSRASSFRTPRPKVEVPTIPLLEEPQPPPPPKENFLNDCLVKLEQRDEAMFLGDQPVADALAERLSGQLKRLRTDDSPRPPRGEEEANVAHDSAFKVNLDWPPTAHNVEALVDHFYSNPQTLIPKVYVNKLLALAEEVLRAESVCPSVVVGSDAHTRMILVGDLHGQLNDLLWLLHLHGLPSPTGNQYFFNGDFVDRGPHGMEVLTLLLTMKCVWPNTVFLNRGNHECVAANMMYGFARECQGKYTLRTFKLCQAVFDALPLAHILNDSILVVHGGLTRHENLTIGDLRQLPRGTQISSSTTSVIEEIIFDLLWADPVHTPGHITGARGPESWQFGPDVTGRFLANNNLMRIIRSHQVPSTGNGYEMFHDHRVITVFSASNYCGVTGNKGGVLVVTPDLNLQATEYYSPPLAELPQLVRRGALPTCNAADAADILQATLTRIREFIVQRKQELAVRFQQCTGGRSTLVSETQWVQTMAFVLGLDIDWAQLLPHLVDRTPDGAIDYHLFLQRYQIEVGAMLKKWVSSVHQSLRAKILRDDLSLRDMIQMFDLNGNGYIDAEELRSVLATCDVRPTPGQLHALTDGLLHNEHGEVLVTSFIDSLHKRPTVKELNLDERGQQTLIKLRHLLRMTGCPMVTVFTRIDTSGNGMVETEEFITAMGQLVHQAGMGHEITAADLREVVQAIDTNRSGTLCYMEFVDAFAADTAQAQRLVNHILQCLLKFRITLERAFLILDLNSDGHISLEEFQTGLTMLNDLVDGAFQLSEEDIRLLVLHLDVNEDGTVDYTEFCNAFTVVDARACMSPVSTPRLDMRAPSW